MKTFGLPLESIDGPATRDNVQLLWETAQKALLEEGLTMVTVEGSPALAANELSTAAAKIGSKLEQAGFGGFDSEIAAARRVFFCVISTELAKALPMIKDELADAGLLPETKIAYFDQHEPFLRTFYPSLPQ